MATPSKLTTSRRGRQFCKPFHPQLYSEHLRIPPAFVKHIGDHKSPSTISLKGPGGGVWYADLVNNSGELFFDKGWKEFVHDHSLQFGDFLVFEYTGNMRFNVSVFDGSTCEKEAARLVRPSRGGECIKEVAVADGVSPKRRRLRKRMSDECIAVEGMVPPKRGRGRPRKNSIILNDQPRLKEKLVPCKEDLGEGQPLLKDDGQPLLKEKLVPWKEDLGDGQPLLKDDGQPLLKEKLVPCKEGLGDGQPLLKEKLVPCKAELDHVRAKRQLGVRSQRRPVTPEEVEKALLKAKAFNSEHPFCIIQMRDSYVYVGFALGIPLGFARQHLPQPSGNVILWDPSGRRWEMKFMCYSRHASLNAGWIKFSITNNLESGDACVFELVDKYEMRVHIYRVLEELTPLIRAFLCRS